MMNMRNIAKLLIRRGRQNFSEESNKKGGIGEFLKSAWRQTFPEEEDQVKNKFQKVKEQKRFTQEELDKIQAETPEYLKGALVGSEAKVEEKDEGFKISKLIPQSLRNKIKQSEQYKEYTAFKQNLKEYASTREGVAANLGATAYSFVAQGSNEAKSTEIMRQYIKDFSIYELQKQSTVIFKTAYHTFLSERISELEEMASEQAYEYLTAHIKLNKSKKWKPKHNQMIFNYPSQLIKARLSQKLLPTFQFRIKIIEIYCMVDAQGKIVEGDEDRVHESVFDFSLIYSGEHVGTQGHPWSIVEIKKIQEMKMLV